MLLVVSPAKTLDLTPVEGVAATRPQFGKDTAELAEVTRKLTAADLRRLMEISDNLAALNVDRFRAFKPRSQTGVPAAFAFAGDVYEGLRARELDAEALAYAQDHLRILSGLYGLLRPLDAIQPYRLEMGVRLQTARGATLYDFWGDRIAKALNKEASGHADRTLVNLASQEYFGAVDARALKLPVLSCSFRDEKDGRARVLAFFAKKARGEMARFAIDQRLETVEGLKDFRGMGYGYDKAASSAREWVFTRPQPPGPAG
jgi:cytoplasmic iron level regulating protein YaaA (DUF328/UPF0246 family)